MKYGASMLAALALAGVTAGAARAQDPIAELNKRGQLYEKGVQTRDRKILESVFHPDGVFINADGDRLDRKGYIDDTLRWAKGRVFSKVEVVSGRNKVFGDTVVGTGTYRAIGTLNGKPYVHEVHFTSVWVKVKGVWMLVNEQGTYKRGSRK